MSMPALLQPPAPASLLSADEARAVYGMAHWLPRAFPTTPPDRIAGDSAAAASHTEGAKSVCLICGLALAAFRQGRNDPQALRDLCQVAEAYLGELDADSELRRVVDLRLIVSARQKLDALGLAHHREAS